jgi:hypothetical protein
MRFLIAYRDGIPYRLASDKNWGSAADIINLPFTEDTDEVAGRWVAPERRGGKEKEENKNESKETRHVEKDILQEKGGRVYGILDALRRMLEEWGEKLEWEEEWKWEEEQEVISADYVDETELELVSYKVYDNEAGSADGEAELTVVGSTKLFEEMYVIEFQSLEETEEVVGEGAASERRGAGQEKGENGKDFKETRMVGKELLEEGQGAVYGNML